MNKQILFPSLLLTAAVAANAAQPRTNAPVGGSALSAPVGRPPATSSRVPGLPTLPTPSLRAPVPIVAPSTTTNAAPKGTNVVAASGSPTNSAVAVAEGADIFFNIDNMPLAQVLDQYSALVNRTILRSSQLPITTFITLKTLNNLTKTEAISALETVMAMNGITVVPIGKNFVKVVVLGEASGAGSTLAKPEDIANLPDSGKFVTEVVQLSFVSLQDATAAITPFASGKINPSIVPIPNSQTLVLRDFSENIIRMLEIIKQIDIISPVVIKPEVIPIKYALASDIAQVLGSLTASGPGLTVGSSSSHGLSGGGASGPSGVSSGGYYPPGTTPPSGSNPNSPMSSRGTTGRSNFASRLSNIMGRVQGGAGGGGAGDFQILGQTKIISDERTNSLLIFANDEDMKTIKDIIAKLDVVLAQVLIEAIVMEVSIDDGKRLGISYLQEPKKLNGPVGVGAVNNATPFINPLNSFVSSTDTNSSTTTSPLSFTNFPGGFSYFMKFGGQHGFDLALTAAANDSRVNVLSRPRIQTSHAVEATLFIGDTIPYVTGTYFGGINGQASSQYQQKEVGITLNVLPLINPDGLVVMDIAQNIEQLGTSIKIDQNEVPTTTKRQAQAKVAVRDQDTVVLGGFISTTKSLSKSGVPYLKDLPWLGALFRSKSDSTKRVELMVFIRPTVLPTPEAAALEANSQRESLPGLRRSDYEMKEEERKRSEEVDKELRGKVGLPDSKKKKTVDPAPTVPASGNTKP